MAARQGCSGEARSGGRNEPEEREADRMAASVLKADAESGGGDRIDALGSGTSRPLDQASRAFFEPRFGADLSAVRIHDDPATRTLARTMGARPLPSAPTLALPKINFARTRARDDSCWPMSSRTWRAAMPACGATLRPTSRDAPPIRQTRQPPARRARLVRDQPRPAGLRALRHLPPGRGPELVAHVDHGIQPGSGLSQSRPAT